MTIKDPMTGEVLLETTNAIHYENFSTALAYSVADKGQNFIYELHLGNGATSVDPTGVITYLPPNVTGQNANLYNPTYYKIVDDTSTANPDPLNNNMRILHTPGNTYTDIFVTCLLNYGEPAGQTAFDNSSITNGTYVFDELGLFGYLAGSPGQGQLLTHAVMHPIQKALNRLIQIEYTVRISSITTLVSLV